MAITVIKRDGRKVNFDPDKISSALSKISPPLPLAWIGSLTHEVECQVRDGEISVETIQDLVEKALVNHNLFGAAKAFILYRNERNKERDLNSTLNKTISELVTV